MFDLASYRHSGSHRDVTAALCHLAEDASTRFFFFRDGARLPQKDPSLPPQEHLQPGDAILVCTEGFWTCIFEPEITVDLLKSASAREWLDYLLVRLAEKTRLNGDDFTALCGMRTKEEETLSP